MRRAEFVEQIVVKVRTGTFSGDSSFFLSIQTCLPALQPCIEFFPSQTSPNKGDRFAGFEMKWNEKRKATPAKGFAVLLIVRADVLLRFP